jgi:hypothetical protein
MPTLKVFRTGSGKNSAILYISPFGSLLSDRSGAYILAEEKEITVNVSASGTTSVTRPNEGDGTKTVKTEASYEISQSFTFDICECEERQKESEFEYQITYQSVCFNPDAEEGEEEWTEKTETVTGTGQIVLGLTPFMSDTIIDDGEGGGYDALNYCVQVQVFVGNSPPNEANCFYESEYWGGIGAEYCVNCRDKNLTEQVDDELNIDEPHLIVDQTQTMTLTLTLS